MFGTELLVMLLMILINSVFAGYELALASVSLGRLQVLAAENRRGARSALHMKQKMEASLAVVQLGITLVAAVAAATGGAGAEEFIEPILRDYGLAASVAQLLAIALVVLPLTVVTIIFGELVPKVFALRNREWVCLRTSPAMEWFAAMVWPAVWVLEGSVTIIMRWGEGRWKSGESNQPQSEEAALQELRAVAALARTSRLIGFQQERIILSAARISSTPIRQIMLPAEHISMLDVDDSLSGALIAAHHDMHTRFPATEKKDDPQAIVGYVNFKDIVNSLRLSPHDSSLRGVLRPLPALRPDQSVASALEQLIHRRHHIALVRDANDTVLGMVTLEDMLEELVGEIQDEYDRLPSHISRVGQGWIVGGDVSLARLADHTGITLEANAAAGATSLSDWLTQHLNRPVEGGDVVEIHDTRLLVRKERRQAAMEVLVQPKRTTPQ